ncbi:fidgetin isoform X1 [Physeter macrocephalus]|uniref:Fidgetin n=2 Tax=Physeter macrocephalus TaxID=9755 RepID=A0A2Y9ENF4_PHYMC|nr:fidgetin isoform X1 [Physeter catodon]XP_058908930.1 fidgetin isoform X1 [Kogia breviceps]|eukprot:XP_007105944.1 fidgetin isoform X1 [Physeter catodon]
MISSTSVYGLKMQWTPEHAQWPEQHFDITSTTRSPAHKVEAYRGHLQRTYQYAWANDDISALTASNLLKKYAEKYSGILEGPVDRPVLSNYSDAPSGLVNGRKNESEPWQPSLNSDAVYPMNCVPDVITASKAGVSSALPPADVSASIGSSPGVASNLTEPSYSSSTCGSHTVPSLHTGLPSQEYAPGYNGSYLHSTYSSQPAPALPSPHPSPLHSSGLLQPPPPPPPPPALVPGYNGTSNLSSYSYPSASYPPHTAVGSGYSPGGAPPPPSAYLPSGIPAPTPLPPTTVPGYTYQGHGLTPIAPAALANSSASSLKRKAFYMAGQGDMDSSYGNYSYGQQRSTQSPMYRMPDNSISNSNRGNGFDRSAETSSLAFKPTKQLMSSEQQRKFSSQSSRALTPPSYSTAKNSLGSRSSEPFGKYTSPVMSEHGDEHRQLLSHPMPGPGLRAATSSNHSVDEQLKNTDTHLIDLVTNEIITQGPPVDWNDIAGLDLVKAVIKEEVLWPVLRSDAFSGLTALPRSILLFGPRGTGKTLLGRCIASQLGATFFKIAGSGLIAKWLGEAEKIIHASFLVARCRQPSVIFVSDIDMLLSSQVSEEHSPVSRMRTEFLMQLDTVLTSAEDQIVVICATSKPEEIDESLRRYFMKRLLIPLPDSTARHQIIVQLLSQHNYCLNDKEFALLVQRTEGFSGLDVAHLCQEAAVGPLHAMPATDLSAIMPSQLRPVTYQDFENAFCKIQPSISQKELDMYVEWNKMFGCSQ